MITRVARAAWVFAVAATVVVMAGAPSAGAVGTVVVSGDVTPMFSLGGTPGAPPRPDNQRFFLNLLGPGGGDVVIYRSTFNMESADQLQGFYAGRVGITSMIVESGPVTVAGLIAKELLVLPVPDDAFTAAEVAAISSFLEGGGTLYVTGEGSQIPFGPATNAIVNNLLIGLAVPVRLDNTGFDIGMNTATGEHILPHPLMAGVTQFNYGAATSLTGGTPLVTVSGSSGPPFMAVVTVPEPGVALAFFAGGAAAVGTVLFGRRRRRVD